MGTPARHVNRTFLILATISACTAPQPPPGAAGPGEAVQDFAAALQRGDAAAAYALLSTKTRWEADRLAAQARAAAGDSGIAPESGRQMLLGSALPQGKVQVREVGRDGPDAARVEVIDSSQRARTYRVVREGPLWKIELDLAVRDGG